MLRRFKPIRALALALALALLFSTTAFAATLGVIKMPTKDGSVNLRSGPGTNYRVIGWAFHGDDVQILKANSQWDRVRVVSTGQVGYIRNIYISRLASMNELSDWGQLARVKTKYETSVVNLRKGPGMSYAVKQTLPSGSKLAVIGKIGSWYEVQVIPTPRTGYIHKDYLTNGVLAATTGNVHLRKAGNSSAAILRVVPDQSEIIVLKVGKKWSKVTYNGRTGYMYNKYIKVF